MWIKVRVKKKRLVSIPFPISLYVFQELLDCLSDILSVACFLAPKATGRASSTGMKIHSAKALVKIVMKLLDSLGGDEPYDLVDVTTDNCKVLIKVR